jgi:hypothetical protein
MAIINLLTLNTPSLIAAYKPGGAVRSILALYTESVFTTPLPQWAVLIRKALCTISGLCVTGLTLRTANL